jgi:uncharacterized protein (TIGR02594 family)
MFELSSLLYSTAQKYRGVRELPGIDDNPKIEQWFRDAGATWIRDDEHSWCAAFICGIARECGAYNPRTVRAKSFLSLPEDRAVKVGIPDLQRGDVLVLSLGKGRYHVTFFAGFRGDDHVRGLGGNQSNMVRLSTYDIADIRGAVRLGPADGRGFEHFACQTFSTPNGRHASAPAHSARELLQGRAFEVE